MPTDRIVDPEPFDRTGLERATGLAAIEVLAEVASTMERARFLAAEPGVRLPLAVVADRQTAGRGRRGARSSLAAWPESTRFPL